MISKQTASTYRWPICEGQQTFVSPQTPMDSSRLLHKWPRNNYLNIPDQSQFSVERNILSWKVLICQWQSSYPTHGKQSNVVLTVVSFCVDDDILNSCLSASVNSSPFNNSINTHSIRWCIL